MRKLVHSTVTTLDGFIGESPEELDWIPADDELHRHFSQELASADVVLYDRAEYEIMVPYWDDYDIEDAASSEAVTEFARVFRATTRVVFSNALESVDERATLVADEFAGEIARLKSQPGGYLLLLCGPELLATCVEHDLIDEFRLLVFPVALGKGKSLFGSLHNMLRLELLSTTEFGSGVVLHCYRPAPRSS
jgi:dihydrofolate reductase